jgi:hypothetical protein
MEAIVPASYLIIALLNTAEEIPSIDPSSC